MAARFQIGDVARLTAQFGVFVNGLFQAKDPDTITLRVKDPKNKITVFVSGTDPEVVRTGVGAYRLDQALDRDGTWHQRWEGTGEVPTAEEGKWTVDPSVFPNVVACC